MRMTHASLFSGIGGFACGNAIVPQVALRIFETINEYEVVKQQDSRKISK